jgi:hypothetical protein
LTYSDICGTINLTTLGVDFMKKVMLNLSVITLQLVIVVAFLVSVFSDVTSIKRKVNIAHNNNLDKIADSVSILFLEEPENIVAEEEEKTVPEILEEVELPSIEEKEEIEALREEQEQEAMSEPQPLISLDVSKYKSNPTLGFVITDDNRQFELSDEDFDLVVAIVSAEYEKSIDDALAVISVILNRCDSPRWSNWAGKTPREQVTKPNQFEVYTIKSYLKYMPDGSLYNTQHRKLAAEAVTDALNGIRNNKYDSFRSWSYLINGDYYSYNYIVEGGNRYK